MRILLFLGSIFGLTYMICHTTGVTDRIGKNMRELNSLQNTNNKLFIENKSLHANLNELKVKIKTLEAQNSFLNIKLSHTTAGKSVGRGIASVSKVKKSAISASDDLVQFDIYKWSAEKLLAIASKELFFKNYKKASQFYQTYLTQYPKHKAINDKVLFEAGIASYESGVYYSWSQKYFNRVISEYPSSEYRRGAKLWKALASLNLGDNRQFMETVDEFRVKYRNTEEWRILSAYYENIAYKFKR